MSPPVDRHITHILRKWWNSSINKYMCPWSYIQTYVIYLAYTHMPHTLHMDICPRPYIYAYVLNPTNKHNYGFLGNLLFWLNRNPLMTSYIYGYCRRYMSSSHPTWEPRRHTTLISMRLTVGHPHASNTCEHMLWEFKSQSYQCSNYWIWDCKWGCPHLGRSVCRCKRAFCS